MKHVMFTVYDQKADAHLPPFILPNIAMAERIFTECAGSDDHQFGRNPEDYTLLQIAEFDDENAELILTTPQKVILTALQAQSLAEKKNNAVEESSSSLSNGSQLRAST